MSFFNPTHLINTYGTAGVLLVVFLESGILPAPLPGDSLLFLAGLFASTSATGDHPHLNLAVVLIGAFLVAVIGAEIGYVIGRYYGTKLFKPDARIFKTKYLERAHEFFERRGAPAVVIARFVPFVRTIVPMLAGTSNMRHRAFAIANVIGAAIWAVGVTIAGYFIGGWIGEKNVEKYDYAIVAVIVVLSLIPPYLEYRRQKRENAATIDA
jgi:membrane-associated protein